MGDFNTDLLKYDGHNNSSDFLDVIYALFLLPYLDSASRITLHSKPLIDNIFSNMIEDGYILGNLVTTISNHYGNLF